MEDLPLAALVLVGGYGTRLRPLTFTRSKPLVEFCNRPMVSYMLDALRDVGCQRIVLALSEIQRDLEIFIENYQRENPGVKIIPSVETVALGTAGPIALAAEHLRGFRFFMLNSDVISPYPFKELLEFHKAHQAEGSIMTWDVEDPSRFGVVVHDENGKVERFVEKPKEFVGRGINAGHYILEPSVIDRVEMRPTSIEREIFPKMASEGVLYATPIHGFWEDIGTPQSFLAAIPIFLKNEDKTLIEADQIGENAHIGPNVVIGKGVVIGDNCTISDATIMDGCRIGDNVTIKGSIIGWKSKIGNGATVEAMTSLGEDVTVAAGITLHASIVCPHKSVNESIDSKIIL